MMIYYINYHVRVRESTRVVFHSATNSTVQSKINEIIDTSGFEFPIRKNKFLLTFLQSREDSWCKNISIEKAVVKQ